VASLALTNRAAILPFQGFRHVAVSAQVVKLLLDERAELGIFTIEERTQPTLPGVEEAVTETSNGTEIVPDPASIPSVDELVAGMESGALPPTVEDNTPARGIVNASKPIDAPMCMQCGVHMVRAGSCHACPSCGSTSGCS